MWKYTVVELRLHFKMGGGNVLDLRDKLNNFGRNGWELVSIEWRNCEIKKHTKIATCVFKQRNNLHKKG